MPIRPENKNRYPKDWSAISARIRERAGNKCEECGVSNGELGGRRSDGAWMTAHPTGTSFNGYRGCSWPAPGDLGWCENLLDGSQARLRIVKIVLTVAHLDHQPENCADDNLKAWCQRCHNRYDAKERARGIKERRRSTMALGELF